MVLDGCVLFGVMVFLAKARSLVGEKGDCEIVRVELFHDEEESVLGVDCAEVSVRDM